MADRSVLADVELFRALSPEAFELVAAEAKPRDLARGDVLFSEGDEADELFVVVHGRVAIANRSPDGRESVVALMEAGDIFGEMSLFDGQGRSADARALEPTQLFAVAYEPVRNVLQTRPEMLWGVVGLLARRLRSMDNALADAVFLDVTGRTAKRLLDLAGDDDEFEIPITQEELAGLVGASRERVNKAISSFIRLGWLEQVGRRYRVLDRGQLEIRAR